jgi:hypothetical protein
MGIFSYFNSGRVDTMARNVGRGRRTAAGKSKARRPRSRKGRLSSAGEIEGVQSTAGEVAAVATESATNTPAVGKDVSQDETVIPAAGDESGIALPKSSARDSGIDLSEEITRKREKKDLNLGMIAPPAKTSEQDTVIEEEPAVQADEPAATEDDDLELTDVSTEKEKEDSTPAPDSPTTSAVDFDAIDDPDELRQELESTRRSAEKYKKLVIEARQKIEAAATNQRFRDRELREALAEVKRYQDGYEQQKGVAAELVEKLKETEQKFAGVNEELKITKETLGDTEETLNQARTKNSDYKKRLHGFQAQVEDLEKDLKKTTTELERTQSELQKKTAEADSLSNAKTDLEGRLKKEATEAARLENELSNRKKAVASIRKALKELDAASEQDSDEDDD